MVDRFVEQFALTLNDGGFPRMSGRVLVTLLISDLGRLTASELVARLQVSPAAISGAVRDLNALGMVTRVREPGERRDAYKLSENIWYESLFRSDQRLIRYEKELLDGIEVVGQHSPGGIRLDETRRFFAFLRAETSKILEKWQEVRMHEQQKGRDASPHESPR